jgi:hypothetical protein
MQDLWAQCAESWAFSVDPAIKYGGGPPAIQQLLMDFSSKIQAHEWQMEAELLSWSEDAAQPKELLDARWQSQIESGEKLRTTMLDFKREADLRQSGLGG